MTNSKFTWTVSRNKDGFSFSAKQVKVSAKRDPRDPAKTSGVDVETKPRKARKKSPSQRAHDRARRKRYIKKIAALMAASRQREQQTRDSEKGETAAAKGLESLAPQSEQPASHCVNNELKVVKSSVQGHLTGESDTVSVPFGEVLCELSAEVAESRQLSETAEQQFLQDLVKTLEADSTIDSDDEVLPKYKEVCTNCRVTLGTDHISCDKCKDTLYCSLKCREKDFSFHMFACSVVAKRSGIKQSKCHEFYRYSSLAWILLFSVF